MITYANSENEQYTVLFNKASMKLGLVPFDKEVGIDADGNPIFEKWMYYEDNGWKTRKCILYDDTPGADNSNADFNAEGEFLINKVTMNGDEQVVTKVVSKGISSLNDYFQHMPELAGLAIGQGRSGSDPYFLRLPLDEPFFEINANTRGITVPGELSQIGIVGDKLAEVVFFRIDRYFDAIDLDTRHIYIEWEAPGPDGTTRKGISRDFLRDTQSQKNKIIFGWAIGEELTKYIGTIRFAVRFVEWANHEDTSRATSEGTGLMYSFSTLPATVSISDSLHYSLFEDDEAFEFISENTDSTIWNLYNYLEASAPDSADETAPAESYPPVFYRNLDVAGGEAATKDATISTESNREVYVHNLFGGGKNEEHGSLELVAEAWSRDSGTITYLFGYKSNIARAEGEQDAGTEGIPTKTKFIKVAFGVAQEDQNDPDVIYLAEPYEKISYYEKASDGVYEPVAISDIEDGTVYYERVSYAIVDRAGFYHVNARNRVSGLKEARATSYTLYVPYAAMPTIEESGKIPTNFVSEKVEYTQDIDMDLDQSITENSMKSNISYVPGPAGDAELVIAPVVTASDSLGTGNFSYQWYVSHDNHDTAMLHAVPLEGATGPSLTVSAADKESSGCYAVKIDNHFNNDHTETALLDAGVCRVTPMPAAPEPINWENFENRLTAGDTIPDILIEAPADYDEVRYEWHMVTDEKDADPIAEGYFAENAKVSDTLTFKDENISGVIRSVGHIKFAPVKAGNYYLILSNELNTATITVNLAKDTRYGMIVVQQG